ATNAEQVDLLPTILDYLNIPAPQWAEGESLRPMIERSVQSERPKFSMNFERASSFAPYKAGSVAVMRGNHKFVHYVGFGCEELYDLSQDPDEHVNLAPRDAPTADALRALAGLRAGHALPAPSAGPPPSICAKLVTEPD